MVMQRRDGPRWLREHDDVDDDDDDDDVPLSPSGIIWYSSRGRSRAWHTLLYLYVFLSVSQSISLSVRTFKIYV